MPRDMKHDAHRLVANSTFERPSALRRLSIYQPSVTISDGYPSGKVGLYTNVAGMKFDFAKWWNDAEAVDKPAKGSGTFEPAKGSGTFGAHSTHTRDQSQSASQADKAAPHRRAVTPPHTAPNDNVLCWTNRVGENIIPAEMYLTLSAVPARSSQLRLIPCVVDSKSSGKTIGLCWWLCFAQSQ